MRCVEFELSDTNVIQDTMARNRIHSRLLKQTDLSYVLI